jgi:hypothetical protein
MPDDSILGVGGSVLRVRDGGWSSGSRLGLFLGLGRTGRNRTEVVALPVKVDGGSRALSGRLRECFLNYS